MKLRFQINQKEALRQGVDAPTSIIDIEVDPATLTQAQRDALADRLAQGIEVHQLLTPEPWNKGPVLSNAMIVAMGPSLACLLEAIIDNDNQIVAEQSKRLEQKQARFQQACQVVSNRKTRESYFNTYHSETGANISYKRIDPAFNFDDVDTKSIPGYQECMQELKTINHDAFVRAIERKKAEIADQKAEEKKKEDEEKVKADYLSAWLATQAGELLEQFNDHLLSHTDALQTLMNYSARNLPPADEVEFCTDKSCPCGSKSLSSLPREIYPKWKALKASLPKGVTLTDPEVFIPHDQVVTDQYNEPEAGQPEHYGGTIRWNEGPFTFTRKIRIA